MKRFNARGLAMTKSPAASVERADVAAFDLIGSQSYNYAVPIIRLPEPDSRYVGGFPAV